MKHIDAVIIIERDDAEGNEFEIEVDIASVDDEDFVLTDNEWERATVILTEEYEK